MQQQYPTSHLESPKTPLPVLGNHSVRQLSRVTASQASSPSSALPSSLPSIYLSPHLSLLLPTFTLLPIIVILLFPFFSPFLLFYLLTTSSSIVFFCSFSASLSFALSPHPPPSLPFFPSSFSFPIAERPSSFLHFPDTVKDFGKLRMI